MNGDWIAPGSWLLRSTLGGGLLLLLVCGFMRLVHQPAWRQCLGEWGMLAALALAFFSLGPVWLPLSVDWLRPPRQAPAALPVPLTQRTELIDTAPFVVTETPPAWYGYWSADASEEKTHQPTAGSQSPATPATGLAAGMETAPASLKIAFTALAPWIIGAYAVGAVFLMTRWLLGYLAVWRLLRATIPAPPFVALLFALMMRDRKRPPRLLVSRALRVPLSCGLFRPTVLLPASMCRPDNLRELRWVFAHELTHLERRDARACLLFGLGQTLFYYLPWFWWLRRQVVLCQEYIADAAAVRVSSRAEDYAQFLLSLTSVPAVHVNATGVLGKTSDLFRRVAMLVQNSERVDQHCPRAWSWTTAFVLLGLAILASGLGLKAANPIDEPGYQVAQASILDDSQPAEQNEPKKEDPKGKKEKKNGDWNFDYHSGVFDNLGFDFVQQPGQPGGVAWEFGFQMAGGRLGVSVEKPGDALADQLELPKDQGILIQRVQVNSAAAKAGLKAHDILLELDGKTVPNDVAKLHQLVEGIKAETPVDAVVLRKGRKETIKGITLSQAKVQPGFAGAGGKGMGFGNFAPMMPGMPGGKGGFGVPAMPGGQGGWGVMAGTGGFAGPNTVITTTFRTDDRFTTRHQEGSLIITLTGTAGEGKVKVKEIQVQDGRESHKYDSVDKVPEQYRDKVKNFLEMSEKSNVKIEINKERP